MTRRSNIPCKGHIVDDWDRRMCGKYLSYFMQDRKRAPSRHNAEMVTNFIVRLRLRRECFCECVFAILFQDDILDEMELVPYAACLRLAKDCEGRSQK